MQSLSSFRIPPVTKSMGLEWEGILPERPPTSYVGFFYVGSDGSIGCRWDEIAVEFVSMPLTQKWLKKEIDKLFKKYPLTENASCGIHLHVSRLWLSQKKGKIIARFLENQADSFFDDMFGRKPGYYCNKAFSRTSRYHSVNFTNTNTIEFRMFRSGDNEWAKYCVDCVCYLIQNAYHLNVEACYAFRSLYNV